jgi:thiamine kinase-like enzyme
MHSNYNIPLLETGIPREKDEIEVSLEEAIPTDVPDFQGRTLVGHDILLSLQVDRIFLLNLLSDTFGIRFVDDYGNTPVLSLTSQKSLIKDEGGRKYFLKQKPDYSLEYNKHNAAIQFQQSVSEIGLAPPLLPNKKGELSFIFGARTFTLTPFIEGNIFDGALTKSINCSHGLGLIHKFCSPQMKNQQDLMPLDSYTETLSFIDMVKGIPFKDQEKKQRVLEMLLGIANKYKRNYPSEEAVGFIHGDFSPFNIVFEKDKLLVVNDFDNVAYAYLSRDLAEAVLTHSGIHYNGASSSLKAPIIKQLDLQRAEAMVKTYLNASGLGPVNIQGFSNEMMFVWLELMSLGLVRGDFSLDDLLTSIDAHEKFFKHSELILKRL